MKANVDSKVPFELLIESSIDAMIAIDTAGTVITWNQAATLLFNMPAADTIGKPLYSTLKSFAQDPALEATIEFARQGKKSYLPASPDHFHRSHLETHIIPLREQDKVIGVMLLLHDVSHRIAKEKELQHLNSELEYRLRQLHLTTNELNRLTNVASFNIRGPIREIYTIVEGLLRTDASALSNNGRAAFRRIQSSLNRMNLLLDDIVTLTQINNINQPEALVDVRQLVQDLNADLAKKLREAKAVIDEGQLGNIRAHQTQVMLLLQQFVLNMLKFADQSPPRIRIETTRLESRSKDGDPGEFDVLSITHNGSVFTNVESQMNLETGDDANIRNYAGPAMAMAIAAKIMDVHRGFIKVEKKPDGTTINCFFPADPSAGGSVLSISQSRDGLGTGM
ncbi:MAG TPA: PAS domain-containing protein [Chitinophagaceae bacterium]|jgi:PAS domain S-box-containing protein